MPRSGKPNASSWLVFSHTSTLITVCGAFAVSVILLLHGSRHEFNYESSGIQTIAEAPSNEPTPGLPPHSYEAEFVTSTISFANLDFNSFADDEFNRTFRHNFTAYMANTASVNSSDVEIVAITSGSAKVESRVFFYEHSAGDDASNSRAADFETRVVESPDTIFYGTFEEYGDVSSADVEVQKIVVAYPSPPRRPPSPNSSSPSPPPPSPSAPPIAFVSSPSTLLAAPSPPPPPSSPSFPSIPAALPPPSPCSPPHIPSLPPPTSNPTTNQQRSPPNLRRRPDNDPHRISDVGPDNDPHRISDVDPDRLGAPFLFVTR
ncbi:hypothetical protein CYMTET_44349 [Cymbomonas tetramitiformis]|uniref:Uncharacterized protein n=1 Tax=Cymbomonas tetramitiformis TaxID=36881 RepID=A0AAE0EZF4_9CHLO|nr:hypothetical protein CYMTET_44349 [Cymbomonas tetramitiformis]